MGGYKHRETGRWMSSIDYAKIEESERVKYRQLNEIGEFADEIKVIPNN